MLDPCEKQSDTGSKAPVEQEGSATSSNGAGISSGGSSNVGSLPSTQFLKSTILENSLPLPGHVPSKLDTASWPIPGFSVAEQPTAPIMSDLASGRGDLGRIPPMSWTLANSKDLFTGHQQQQQKWGSSSSSGASTASSKECDSQASSNGSSGGTTTIVPAQDKEMEISETDQKMRSLLLEAENRMLKNRIMATTEQHAAIIAYMMGGGMSDNDPLLQGPVNDETLSMILRALNSGDQQVPSFPQQGHGNEYLNSMQYQMPDPSLFDPRNRRPIPDPVQSLSMTETPPCTLPSLAMTGLIPPSSSSRFQCHHHQSAKESTPVPSNADPSCGRSSSSPETTSEGSESSSSTRGGTPSHQQQPAVQHRQQERPRQQQRQSRYWTDEEHTRFLQAVKVFGANDPRAIANAVGTRTASQVRSHAQKFFKKLEGYQGIGLPSMNRKKHDCNAKSGNGNS